MTLENEKYFKANEQKEKKFSEQEWRGKIGRGKFVCFFRQGEGGFSIGETMGQSIKKDRYEYPCPKVKTSDGREMVLDDNYYVEGVFDTAKEAEDHRVKIANLNKPKSQEEINSSQGKKLEVEFSDPKKRLLQERGIKPEEEPWRKAA